MHRHRAVSAAARRHAHRAAELVLCGRLEPRVWGAPKRVDVVHSVVRWHLANRRQGTAMVRAAAALPPSWRSDA